jgi:GntR family transcriptional regulator/MocR family aminotransferase
VHREILAASGLEVVPLPVDADGAVIEALDEVHADAVLLTPAHQFPTGVALAPARRAAVVAWAERTGGIVIEDDYDGEFRYDRRAVGALQSLAPDRVVFVGTASKALGPGVGLAWCVLPRELVSAVAEQRRLDGSRSGALAQLALAEFIEHGDYDRVVRSARVRYRARRRQVELAVAQRMPAVGISGMAAGLHCLLELPSGIREEDVSARADAAGLAFHGLQSFRAHGAKSPGARGQAMVVGFGAPPPRLFDDAIAKALEAIELARIDDRVQNHARGGVRRGQADVHGVEAV